jgi:hypothetical protein
MHRRGKYQARASVGRELLAGDLYALPDSRRPGDGVAARAGKLKQALDENRMLVLGVQVLIGFEYESIFHVRFEDQPPYLQWTKVTDLTC